MPRIQNLSAVRGDSFAWKEGVANITTDQIAEAWFTVKDRGVARESVDDSEATTQVKLSASAAAKQITIVDSTTLLVTIDDSATRLWTRQRYVFDLAIRTLAGKEYTLTLGELGVANDVTKST